MPYAPDFLNGFGLIPKTSFGHYVLTSATSTHETISRYHEYQYHITLVFTPIYHGKYSEAQYLRLFNGLMSLTTQTHTIYGIRNPYRCIIDVPVHGDVILDEDGTVTFHLLGHSYLEKNR